MDVLTLSRIQFGATIAFHYIYPPLSIGLGVMLVIMEAAWLKTKNPIYHQMARFWTKVFALTFAIGVATGIVMEFEFGTNWATYSKFVGDVFGSALAAEGNFCVLPRIRFSRGPAFWLGQGRAQDAFFLDVHGLSRRAFQRGLDRRGEFLDADARRLSHRRRGDARARGSHGFLAGGFQSFDPWTGCFTPFAARGRRAHFSSSA
jgi:hypothetical protein